MRAATSATPPARALASAPRQRRGRLPASSDPTQPARAHRGQVACRQRPRPRPPGASPAAPPGPRSPPAPASARRRAPRRSPPRPCPRARPGTRPPAARRRPRAAPRPAPRAPAGLWAASRTSGGSPSTTSIRPVQLEPARRPPRTRSGSSDAERSPRPPRSATAKLRRRYGAGLGELDRRRQVADRDQPRVALAPRSARASPSTSGDSGPSTSVEWSRSTASFSAAISSSVSPSHSVCSSPIEVSAVTRDGSTLVASRRPPSPASITADLDPRRREGDERGGVSASNWVTDSPSLERPVDRLDRLGDPLDRGREGSRLDLGAADPDPLATSARRAARGRRRRASRAPRAAPPSSR